MRTNEATNKARIYFGSGYNCAESVLLAIAEGVLKVKHDLIPKIATGFGGGISRQGCICGAVSGAIMGLGLKYGRSSPEELRARTYNRVEEFLRQFRAKHRSIVCKELCGCDLSTIEGIRKFRDENVHAEKCTSFVSTAVKIFTILINEIPSENNSTPIAYEENVRKQDREPKK